jgi:hypothetical protein
MIYFITEQELKEFTALQNNVEITDLTPFIKTTAEIIIQPILGDAFYKYLLIKYNAETLTSDEQELVDKIAPIMAWRTCSDSVIALSRQLKNKGLQAQNGDYSNSSDLREVAFYSDHYEQKATAYQNKLVEYLKDNKDKFSEYKPKDGQTPTDSFNNSILFI